MVRLCLTIGFEKSHQASALLHIPTVAIPGMSQMKLLRQAHHLIPNQIFKEYKAVLKDMGWIQNHKQNLIDLPVPFH